MCRMCTALLTVMKNGVKHTGQQYENGDNSVLVHGDVTWDVHVDAITLRGIFAFSSTQCFSAVLCFRGSGLYSLHISTH